MTTLSVTPDAGTELRRSNLLDTEAGRQLWHYWTRGEGLARWRLNPRPWTALHAALLKEGVPEDEAGGLATNIFIEVFHETPAQHTHGRTRRPEGGAPMLDMYRSFPAELEIRSAANGGDGRTVTGIAVPWERPQRIDDKLTESFTRGAFSHQLGAVHRVGFEHEHVPLGGKLIGRMVQARDDAAGLYGEFRVSKTPSGDEALELIRDGVLPHLSVHFRAAPGGNRVINGITQRTKADLVAVAATRDGQYGDDASISGVRSAADQHNGTPGEPCPECGQQMRTANLDRARQLATRIRPVTFL